MNFYSFFTDFPLNVQENTYPNHDFLSYCNQITKLLNQKNDEIQKITQDNQKLKQTVNELQNQLQNTRRQDKPVRKPTKNYYRKNISEGENTHSRLYCPWDDCLHHYSSVLALNFHIKMKHNGGNKKQRQAYAKIILQAQEKGDQIPKINFNFPPGFLEVHIDVSQRIIERHIRIVIRILKRQKGREEGITLKSNIQTDNGNNHDSPVLIFTIFNTFRQQQLFQTKNTKNTTLLQQTKPQIKFKQ